MSDQVKKRVVVLGAGVIGLTTALRLQEEPGYQVEIIADVLPTDPKTIRYTSHWAGAHHVDSAPSGTIQGDLNRATFKEMWDLSSPGGEAEHCFLRLPQVKYYEEERMEEVNPFLGMPNFRELSENELIPGAKTGDSFDTVTIDTPIYLNWLLSCFLKKGGRAVRGRVQHIDEVIEAGSAPFQEDFRGESTGPNAIVVCAGLGARFLGGVEDQSVYPSRGQTVILRAPWVRFGRTLVGKNGEWTYIIPRRSGDVVVGGIQEADDWYPKPRQETKEDILSRGFALCPELAPPEIRSQRSATIDDLYPLIVEEGCGLRPMRKGGLRLEKEYFSRRDGSKIPVVFNYGHGPIGYISSIGSADYSVKLVQECSPVYCTKSTSILSRI